MIQPQGLHIIAELSGCNSEKIGDEAFVKQALTEAAHHANAVICELSFHKFSPQIPPAVMKCAYRPGIT